ncbi:MAG TPA: fimbria/pilus periplasmic chaperone [Burkholderiaceae bacterium]
MTIPRLVARAPALALAALAACQCTHAADLAIMPVAVQLDAAHDRTTVRVTNTGKDAVVLQADAIGWSRRSGVDIDSSTDDLIVNPPVFTVAPGATQIVRVGLRRNSPSDHESTYRMVLREVPSPVDPADEAVQGQVRVLVALRVPVYVAPAVVRHEQRWIAHYDVDGRLVAGVTNTGNVHYKIGTVRLASTQDSVATRLQGPESVVMPGEAREIALEPPAAGQAGKPLALEVLTDRGLQHVSLDVASR